MENVTVRRLMKPRLLTSSLPPWSSNENQKTWSFTAVPSPQQVKTSPYLICPWQCGDRVWPPWVSRRERETVGLLRVRRQTLTVTCVMYDMRDRKYYHDVFRSPRVLARCKQKTTSRSAAVWRRPVIFLSSTVRANTQLPTSVTEHAHTRTHNTTLW